MRARSSLALAVVFTVASLEARAAGPEAGTDYPHAVDGGIPQEVAARAGIPEAKQREIARLTAAANTELERLRKDHRAAQSTLETLLKANPPAEREVLAQVERVGAAETAIRKNRVTLMLRVREVLGPSLWATLQNELSRVRAADETPRVGEPVQMETTGGTLRPPPRRH